VEAKQAGDRKSVEKKGEVKKKFAKTGQTTKLGAGYGHTRKALGVWGSRGESVEANG